MSVAGGVVNAATTGKGLPANHIPKLLARGTVALAAILMAGMVLLVLVLALLGLLAYALLVHAGMDVGMVALLLFALMAALLAGCYAVAMSALAKVRALLERPHADQPSGLVENIHTGAHDVVDGFMAGFRRGQRDGASNVT